MSFFTNICKDKKILHICKQKNGLRRSAEHSIGVRFNHSVEVTLPKFRENLFLKVFFSTPHCGSFHQERVIFELLAILQDILEK